MSVDNVDLVDLIAIAICETLRKLLLIFNKVMDKGHTVKAGNFSLGQDGLLGKQALECSPL